MDLTTKEKKVGLYGGLIGVLIGLVLGFSAFIFRERPIVDVRIDPPGLEKRK